MIPFYSIFFFQCVIACALHTYILYRCCHTYIHTFSLLPVLDFDASFFLTLNKARKVRNLFSRINLTTSKSTLLAEYQRKRERKIGQLTREILIHNGCEPLLYMHIFPSSHSRWTLKGEGPSSRFLPSTT